MKRVLTQEEIDALLQSIPIDASRTQDQTFTVGNKKVTKYDFRHPNCLSHQARKILEQIHEDFSKELGQFLTDKLRTEITTHPIALEQMILTEYIESLKSPNCLYVFEVENYSGKGVFEIQPTLVYFIVDRTLGGPGRLLETERELTQIEQRIMAKLISQILELFRTSWQTTAAFQPVYKNYCSNPNFLQIAESGESIVTISLEVNFGDNVGLFNIAYPYLLIEKLIPTMETSLMPKQGKVSEVTMRWIQKNLEDVTVPVIVKLGEAKISFEELINLQNGDVLCLEKHVDEDLELLIEDKPKFWGRAGMLKNHFAFQISNPIRHIEEKKYE